MAFKKYMKCKTCNHWSEHIFGQSIDYTKAYYPWIPTSTQFFSDSLLWITIPKCSSLSHLIRGTTEHTLSLRDLSPSLALDSQSRIKAFPLLHKRIWSLRTKLHETPHEYTYYHARKILISKSLTIYYIHNKVCNMSLVVNIFMEINNFFKV